MKAQTKPVKTLLGCLGFLTIFCIILTVLTLLYLPKWTADTESNGGIPSFYREPKNTIDVIGVGSCNFYTSYSPLLAYEEYGYTSYLLTCPDQQMLTSYYLVKEALARQDVKLVMVEALFLTEYVTTKRETYNRESLEYIPWSFNKLQMTADTVQAEVKAMQSFDPSSPGEPLSFAGYLFPLLRYHDKTEFSEEDITFYFDEEKDMYGHLKGGVAAFDRINHNSLEMEDILNGYEIKEEASAWFLKIKALCDEKGIQFLLVKSPNIYRWNEELDTLINDYAESHNIDLIDFGQEQYDFNMEDYSYSTGRLNVYGQKKLTHYLGDYVVSHYDVPVNVLSETDDARWRSDIAYLYNLANEQGFSLDAGEIQRAVNLKEGIRLAWNPSPGAKEYCIYRITESTQEIAMVGQTRETQWLDENVVSGEGYTYRVETIGGSQDGKCSKGVFHIFVAAPEHLSIVNGDKYPYISWSAVENADSYELGVRRGTYFPYVFQDEVKTPFLSLSEANGPGRLRFYSLRARIIRDGVFYYSDSVEATNLFLRQPVIQKIETTNEGIHIAWDAVSQLDVYPSPHTSLHDEDVYPEGGIPWSAGYEIFRAEEGTDSFMRIGSVSHQATEYLDTTPEPGKSYVYRLRAVKTVYDVDYYSADSATFNDASDVSSKALKEEEGKPYLGLWMGEGDRYYLFYKYQWLSDYSGFYHSRDGRTYLIENGVWNWTTRLVYQETEKQYYLFNRGVWDLDTTLYHSRDGNIYYIENGIWDQTFTGEITEEGITYVFENGKCMP